MAMDSKLKKLGKLLSVFDSKEDKGEKEEKPDRQVPQALLIPLMKELSVFLDETAKKKDVLEMVKGVASVMKEARKDIGSDVSEFKKETKKTESLLLSQVAENTKEVRKIRSELDEATAKTNLAKIESLGDEIQKVKASIPKIPDHSGTFDDLHRKIARIPPPSKAEAIATSLEMLPENEKLTIDAIADLRKELDEIKKMRSTPIKGGGVRTVGRDIIQNYDLSPYLNGVTKTFEIPTTWSIVSVATSSFPNVLRPTIDYTNDSNHITFTSEIDESTTLATGQTVVLTLVTFF